MLPSAPTLRHVLVTGVDGVRFDLLDQGGPARVTRQTQVAPLVLAALGDITGG